MTFRAAEKSSRQYVLRSPFPADRSSPFSGRLGSAQARVTQMDRLLIMQPDFKKFVPAGRAVRCTPLFPTLVPCRAATALTEWRALPVYFTPIPHRPGCAIRKNIPLHALHGKLAAQNQIDHGIHEDPEDGEGLTIPPSHARIRVYFRYISKVLSDGRRSAMDPKRGFKDKTLPFLQPRSRVKRPWHGSRWPGALIFRKDGSSWNPLKTRARISVFRNPAGKRGSGPLQNGL